MRSLPPDPKDFKARIIFFLREYWIGISIQILWAVISCVLAIIYHDMEILPPNDFAQYYYAAQQIFQNPVKVYDPSFLLETYGVNAFRYFPTVLILFFAPFSVIPLWNAFVIFTIISCVICLVSTFLILEIIRKVKVNANERFLKFCITAFLSFPFFFDFYFFGQISCILGFLLLLSLYFYLLKREMLGSLFLGASLMVKPVPFLQILFLLFVALQSKDYKLLFRRLMFILLPLVPDALIFLLVPGMLNGFLYVNMEIFGTRTSAAPTGSFSNFFVSEFSMPSTTVMLVCGIGIIIIGLVLLRKIPRVEDKLNFSFIYGMLGYFVLQVDAWSSQYPYLFPFLIIATMYFTREKPRQKFFALYLIYPIASEIFTIGLLLAFTVAGLKIIMSLFLLYFIIPVVSFSILIITIIVTKEIYKQSVGKELIIE